MSEQSDSLDNSANGNDGIAGDGASRMLVGAGVSTATAYAMYQAYTYSRRIRGMGPGGLSVMPEPSEWLDNNLTLGQAYDAHQTRWFGPQDANLLEALGARDHDAAHILLALTGTPSYQANLPAEAHVLTIQQALSRPILGVQIQDPATLITPRGYADAVKMYSEGYAGPENAIRTLTWIMGGQTQQSMDAVYRSHNYDIEKLIEAAKQQGITIYISPFDPTTWSVETTDGTRYAYKAHDMTANLLPNGTNGIEAFREFTIPNNSEIFPIFKRLQPVLRDLQPQVHALSATSVSGATLQELLDDIPVGDIHARMNGGTTPLAISPAARLRAQGALAELLSAPIEASPSIEEIRTPSHMSSVGHTSPATHADELPPRFRTEMHWREGIEPLRLDFVGEGEDGLPRVINRIATPEEAYSRGYAAMIDARDIDTRAPHMQASQQAQTLDGAAASGNDALRTQQLAHQQEMLAANRAGGNTPPSHEPTRGYSSDQQLGARRPEPLLHEINSPGGAPAAQMASQPLHQGPSSAALNEGQLFAQMEAMAASHGLTAGETALVRAAAVAGDAGHLAQLGRGLGRTLPAIGAAISAPFAAYVGYRAIEGVRNGELTVAQAALIVGASPVYVASAMGGFFTGIAMEEGIDKGLAEAGIPLEYRYGTLRQAMVGMFTQDAKMAEMMRDQPAENVAAVKAVINDPAVFDLSATPVGSERYKAMVASLRHVEEEGRTGREMPMTTGMGLSIEYALVSDEEVEFGRDLAVRRFLVEGGTVHEANVMARGASFEVSDQTLQQLAQISSVMRADGMLPGRAADGVLDREELGQLLNRGGVQVDTNHDFIGSADEIVAAIAATATRTNSGRG